MQTLKVFDPNGVWLVNTGNYAFVDPESGSRFEPGVPSQVTETAWTKLQSEVIKPWVDPSQEQAKAEAEAAAVVAAEAEAKAAVVAAEAEAAAKAEAEAAAVAEAARLAQEQQAKKK